MAITLHAVDPARHDRAVVFAVDGKYARFALFAATQIAALHPQRDFDIVICWMVEDLAAPPTLAHLGIRFCRVMTEDAFDGLRLDAAKHVDYEFFGVPGSGWLHEAQFNFDQRQGRASAHLPMRDVHGCQRRGGQMHK